MNWSPPRTIWTSHPGHPPTHPYPFCVRRVLAVWEREWRRGEPPLGEETREREHYLLRPPQRRRARQQDGSPGLLDQGHQQLASGRVPGLQVMGLIHHHHPEFLPGEGAHQDLRVGGEQAVPQNGDLTAADPPVGGPRRISLAPTHIHSGTC